MDRFYNLLVGSGYNYPGFKYSWQALSGPLVNDDLFLLQLLTMYGLLPVALFLFCVARMRSIPKNAQDYKFLNAANAILICLIVTVAHTNALIRPQIYPVFFLMIVMKHVIYKKYQAETTLGQKS